MSVWRDAKSREAGEGRFIKLAYLGQSSGHKIKKLNRRLGLSLLCHEVNTFVRGRPVTYVTRFEEINYQTLFPSLHGQLPNTSHVSTFNVINILAVRRFLRIRPSVFRNLCRLPSVRRNLPNLHFFGAI